MAARGGKAGAGRRAIAGDIAGDLVEKVHRAWGKSPLYQSRLKGPAPDRLLHRADDPFPGDAAAGALIARGRLSAGAEHLDCEGELETAYDRVARGAALYAYLHRFDWLRHLAAVGETGRPAAMTLARRWFDVHEKWSPDSWAPRYVGERLLALCRDGGFILPKGDAPWRSRVLTSMARQTRHLARAGHRAGDPYDRLTAAIALSVAGLCLPGCDDPLERGLELLRRELRLQVRPDGGHVSRNPARQLELVARLRLIARLLEASRRPAPGFLAHVTGRAAACLRLFRLGDGALAVCNGGAEGDAAALAAALEDVDMQSAPVGFARYSGFQRLEAARTVVVADVGAPAGAESPAGAYSGAGAFHLASGARRIVVNCGPGDQLGAEWAAAMRLPAAHSTLSCEAVRSEIGPSEPGPSEPGVLAERVERLLAQAVATHRRAEDERGHLLEIDRAFADGAGAAGAVQHGRHARRFFLNRAGDDLRGEDALIAPSPALSAGWRLRFHLHPQVKASLARDGRSVLLALENGEGWRFRSNCRRVSLEKSVYCGAGGTPKPAEQIVLSGTGLERAGTEDMVVKWSFRRLEGS